ncbi:unnamed protein product [Boreogadus saida]
MTIIKYVVRLSGVSGVGEPDLAQFRFAEWHNGWGAGEGTAVQALLDLSPEDLWDLQALTRALGEADELALHAFLQGLAPPRLGQHVRLTKPRTLDVALDVAEQAERELSDQPSLQASKDDDRQDPSGPAKHCYRRCGARVAAAGAALSRGTTPAAFQSGQDKDRVRKPRPPDLEPEQFRRVKECGWDGHGRRWARRQRATEDGVPEQRSSAPTYGRNWWGPRWRWSPTTHRRLLLTRGGFRQRRAYSARCGGRASRTEPQLDSRPPEHCGLCDGCWGRRDV